MTTMGRALWRAVEDTHFRQRTLHNLGAALAEEGFILTDSEMSLMREFWDSLAGLSERASFERIAARARAYRRYVE